MTSVEKLYGEYWAGDDAFGEELDRSLNPRGTDWLFTYFAELGPQPGQLVVDIGARDAGGAIRLVREHGLRAIALDPVPLHVEKAREAAADLDVEVLQAAIPSVAVRGLSDGVPGRGTRSRAPGVAEVPWLPRVALDEPEARRVCGQPTVGDRRPEVELGGTAVQRLARRRHPARIGVLSEEPSLLGVGSVGRVDDQRHPRMCSRGGQSVERRRHVRAHRFALSVDQRARVPAAAGHRCETSRRRRGGLRFGARLDPDPAATGPAG